MDAANLALAQGLRSTQATLEAWRRRPGPVLRGWLLGSLLVAVGLLGSVYAIAEFSVADPTVLFVPGMHRPPQLDDALYVLVRNLMVLALHAMACVAGFIAGSALPRTTARLTGFARWVHEKAGPLAIGFVVAATTFSLGTQAFVLGATAATMANQLGLSPAALVLALTPHALPELVALFLPLAAWVIASRTGKWHELLAATLVTVALAVPVLLVTSLVEVYLSPRLLASLAG